MQSEDDIRLLRKEMARIGSLNPATYILNAERFRTIGVANELVKVLNWVLQEGGEFPCPNTQDLIATAKSYLMPSDLEVLK